jgi:hypothetical protein
VLLFLRWRRPVPAALTAKQFLQTAQAHAFHGNPFFFHQPESTAIHQWLWILCAAASVHLFLPSEIFSVCLSEKTLLLMLQYA